MIIKNTPTGNLVEKILRSKMNTNKHLTNNETNLSSIIYRSLVDRHEMTIDKLIEFLQSEKVRLSNEYAIYYSSELIDDLTKFKETSLYAIDDKTFYGSIHSIIDYAKANINCSFNFKNLETLRRHNLTKLINNFDDNFRGDIINIQTLLNDTTIIETLNKNKSVFYVSYNVTFAFNKYEHALIYSMFPNDYSTVIKLYNVTNKDN